MTTALQRLLESGLQVRADDVAISVGNRFATFAELDLEVRRCAAGMVAEGILPGDRVALMLPNRLETVVAILGCYAVGAVAMPLNYRYVAEEAEHALSMASPKLLLFHAERAEVIREVLDRVDPISTFRLDDEGASATAARPFANLLAFDPIPVSADVGEQAPALLLFTSGTTALPRGVVHSHASTFAAIDIARQVFDFQPSDVVLVGKPLSHAGGLNTQSFPALLAASSVVLADKPAAAEAVALITQHQVTEYGMLASDLVDFIEFLEQHPQKLPSLENSIGSGDAVPIDLHHRFRDLFGWQVMEGCGMTEVGTYYTANPRHGKRKWGSMGVACPGVVIRVVDHDDQEVPVSSIGELVLQTPSQLLEYWQNPDATSELLRGGWLHTGDLGRVDEEGYLWFVGRKKLMIVRRGSNIAPAEVESVIDEHPNVHASVVVGLDDAEDGHVPAAFVVPLNPSEPFDLEELRMHVAGHLAAYKNPARYFLLAELPRTGTGKFDRHHLQVLAEGALRGESIPGEL